jgi:hypothetical protein
MNSPVFDWKFGITSGVRTGSAMSMLGVVDCMSVSSVGSSVNIVPRSVFICGPAGIQYSEQEPVELWVGHGGTFALASWTEGKCNWLASGPESDASENATAKRSSSLTLGIVLNFLESGFLPLSLKRLSFSYSQSKP